MNRWMKAVLGGVMAVGTVGCGDPFFVEVEAPKVCEVTQAVTFDGAPIELEVATLQKQLEYKLASALSDTGPVDVQSEVRLVEVRFLATQLSDTLDFIQNATVNVDPPEGSSLQGVEILSYQKSAETTGAKELVLQGAEDTIDIRDYANGDSLRITTSLTGAWPQSGATLDVGACVTLKARADPM